MKIREVEKNDLESLATLFDAYRVFYSKETDLTGSRNFLSERLHNEDSVVYVAENEAGELTGFVQLYPLFSSVRMKRLWLLNDLFVDPVHRGKGISLKLIDRAKKLALETSACALLLETEKSNVIGNNLYPRAGFKLNETSNFYEWDNE